MNKFIVPVQVARWITLMHDPKEKSWARNNHREQLQELNNVITKELNKSVWKDHK